MRYRKAITLAALLLSSALPAQDEARHDVLFIAIDDLNDWVGYLGGHPQTKTPNIDRLAARGMAFMNAQSPSALCNPVRTALLTGLRPSTSGVYGNLPDWRGEATFAGKPTLPRHFRDNGYATIGAGKIFHAHTFNESGFTGYNDTTAWDDFYPSPERQLPDEIGPVSRPANRNAIFSGYDWDAIVAEDSATGDGQVVGWIERQLEAAADRPRFTAAGIYRPHLPWWVPEPYFELHPLETIELPPFADDDLDDVPAIGRRGTLFSVELHEWTVAAGRWNEAVQAYLASVSFADAMVGRLLDALEASGRADRTIIVLWGDHGFHLGEKGRYRKMTLWNESLHVPFVIVAPGVTTPGSVTRAPVSLMDIYPTLVELAGLERPAHVEGMSLVPLLGNPDLEWDYPALSTYGYRNHAVTSERYRYIRYADGSEELYDLIEDPNEWTNLALDGRYQDVIDELASHLPDDDAPDLAASGG
ncbi:MAG TPA: sulfatase [Gammaproteobacteria bacterium]|nr:sulfatase [Gammaproteobacteria bacterium]